MTRDERIEAMARAMCYTDCGMGACEAAGRCIAHIAGLDDMGRITAATAAHDALWPLAMESCVQTIERKTYSDGTCDADELIAAIREGAPK